MRTVIVTGSSGFIGRHLVSELRTAGYSVVQADRQDGNELAGNRIMDEFIGHFKPAAVFHLAAQVGRLFGEDSIERTVTDNAQLTTEIARACAEHETPLVYCSTSEVYGDQRHVACREYEGPFDLPHNLYGLSKRWGEEACELYLEPELLTILRLSMPYGPGVPPGRGRAALPNVLWQAHNRMPIPIHRGAERSWCWVGDTVRGMRMAFEHGPMLNAPQIYNVGRDDPDSRLEMASIAGMACELTGASKESIQIVDPPTRQTVVKRLSMDRLRSIGWEPEVEIEEGMERVLAWVSRFDADGRMVAH